MLHGDYSNMCDTCYHEKITEFGQQYMTDTVWRDTVAARIGRDNDILFAEEKIRNRFTTRAVPLEYARFMYELMNGDILSGDARTHLSGILSWPMRNSKTARDFDSYMAVYDSRMGFLAGVDYGLLPGETEPVSQVFIMENIPVGLFMHLSSNLMTQDFQQRLIWDPDLSKVAHQLLNGTTPKDGISNSDTSLNRKSLE